MRLLNKKAVRFGKLGGCSEMELWRKIERGTFPKPIHIGPRSPRWIEEEVDAWIAGRAAARTAQMPPCRDSTEATNTSDQQAA